jgi:hypothetical protein
MLHATRSILGLAAGALLLVTASAQPAAAAGPYRPGVPPGYMPAKPLPVRPPAVYPPNHGVRPPGWDWWKTYPWSPYNAWKNPYWYPPYNNYYPYPPYPAYPYYPVPLPWGGIGSGNQ